MGISKLIPWFDHIPVSKVDTGFCDLGHIINEDISPVGNSGPLNCTEVWVKMFCNFFCHNINLTAHSLNKFQILNRVGAIIVSVKGNIFLCVLKGFLKLKVIIPVTRDKLRYFGKLFRHFASLLYKRAMSRGIFLKVMLWRRSVSWGMAHRSA